MSKKLNLFDGDSDDDGGDASLSVNKDYAKRYEAWREAEVKEHLKNKVASGFYDDSDGSSSEEGEPERDPEELKQVLSKDFFQLISDLKKKDPKIYDRNVEFFKHEKDEQTSPAGKASKKQSKEKPLYLRDYERKIITERQGELSDESDTEITEDPRSQSPTYVEEQRQLKESFKKALYDDEGSGDEGGLLKKKEKTKAEKKKEEEDYIEWLKGNKASLPDKETEASLKELKTAWNDPNLDEDEKFLRDYVLNRRYLKNHDVSCDEGNVRDDDYEDKYMDTFEQKYNFRYEEPDKEFLKRFPRTMEQSVRHRDTTRKEKRDALKKRKEQEKLVKQEELKLLKSLKRKEIIQKIEQIKQITGNDELGLNADDLEDEFDPEAHDEKMKAIFNDDYYQCEDDAEDEEGLHLPPLGEELLDDDDVPEGNWDNWDNTEQNDGTAVSKEEEYVPHCEDPEFNMDCDYDPAIATARKESKRMSSREKRKLKRQSRFGRLVHKEKPVFDPKDKTFQQYVDEYYGMDYEDLIGDMPCRFKYKSVFPNSFGLTIDEILAADDKELNQWVSIKKAYTIRPESAEKYDAKVYAEKAKNEELKRKILPSLYKHEIENVNENNEKQDKKKRKKKKKKHNTNESENGDSTLVEGAIETVDQATLQAEGSSRNKKKKHHIIEAVDQDPSTSQAQDSHKKKKKKHQLITDEDGRTGVAPIVDTNQIISQAEGSGKKKKKKHQLITDEDGRTGVAPVGDANQITSQAEGSSKKKKKKDFNESVTAHAQDVSNETTNNEMKRKHSDSGVQHQNGWKKAKTNFGQRGAGQKNGMGNVNQEQNISDSRLKAYGLNPKRYKKFQKYGPKN